MRILIKIGSALLSKNNKFNLELLAKKVSEISTLKKNNEIIIITSGAVASGMENEKIKDRPKETLELQLLSGEGQVILMKNYQQLFEKENIRVAQVLLTHHNFDKEDEKIAIMKILNSYLKKGIISIINENDLISKEEIDSKLFTDNDILAALVSIGLKVDLAVILTDVNGLYDSDPKVNPNPKLIEEVIEINENVKRLAGKPNNLGLGGMISKITAAEMMNKEGINVIIANGNLNLSDIIENKVKRTLFKVI